MRDFEHPDSLYPKPEKKTAIVIGLGEIGKPIRRMIQNAYGPDEVWGRDITYPVEIELKFKFMHICFPQSSAFVPALNGYVKKYQPDYIIIHSTLSPGIASYLDSLYDVPVYLSPVRGNIKDGMLWSLKKYTKYVAAFGYSESEYRPVLEHLRGAGFHLEYGEDPTALEWAKILDLAWYGLNIAFYQEIERLAEEEGFDYTVVRRFIRSTPEESEGRAERTLFYGGFIGGHCVIQAIEKILAKKDIPMLREVIFSNIKRKEELLLNRPMHHPIMDRLLELEASELPKETK